MARANASIVGVLLAALSACAAEAPRREPVAASPGGAAAMSSSAKPTSPVTSGGPACEALTDCAACTARPDCRLCTYVRGCMAKTAVDNGACLASALDSPSACSADPVVLRAAERKRDAEARRATILAATNGMTPAGPAFEARLENFNALELPVGAGLCHVLVWSLAPDAKPADVRISLDFVTRAASDGGLTGFDTDARIGSTGLTCSAEAGRIRFRLVDRYTYAPVPAGGTGGISFVLFTRLQAPVDPQTAAQSTARATGADRGGSVGVDCLDCTFPCESAQTACNNECFRSERDWTERSRCERTCEQIYRSCLRGCPGCY